MNNLRLQTEPLPGIDLHPPVREMPPPPSGLNEVDLNADVQLCTWCWPTRPKDFTGPARYDSKDASRIPTGSIYVASRKGPLSEMHAKITGCPYDTIGIIFQTKTEGREGTYVYTINSSLLSAQSNPVVSVNLLDLMKDDNIIYHAVLPLKDFEDKPNVAQGNSQGDCYNDQDGCVDSLSWKCKLRERRNEILRDLFKTYRDRKPEHDSYQMLASIVGLSVSENVRTKNAVTAAELTGLILFQAGLIWDDRFSTDNMNPACCLHQSFFKKLSHSPHPGEAVVTLTTPFTYMTMKSREPTLMKEHRKDYPEAVLKRKKHRTEKGDEKTRSSLQSHLNSSLTEEYHCEYTTTDSSEKGGVDITPYRDFYNGQTGGYKRCYHPADWMGEPYQAGNGHWLKPVQRCMHVQTISFASLRPVDFLMDYYRSTGVNRYEQLRHQPLTGRRGASGELVAIVHSLASELGCDREVNSLNMSWYHDNLIPLELNNNSDESCESRIEREASIMKEVVSRLDRDLIQKRMIHLSNYGLTGGRLHHLCKRTSELAAELHALACESNAHVRWGQKDGVPVRELHESDTQGEYKFKMKVEGSDKYATDYLMVLHRYMWSPGWKYDWVEPLRCSREKYYEMNCRIQKLIQDSVELKNRTPISCIVLELIVCLLEQAKRFYRYLYDCRDQAYPHLIREKGGDIDVDEILQNIVISDSPPAIAPTDE